MKKFTEELLVKYRDLFVKYADIIEDYFGDNSRKLHKTVDTVLNNLHFYDVDETEYYSLTDEIFITEVLANYDDKQDFMKFLKICLYKKFCTYMTRTNRDKRSNNIKVPKRDENGEIMFDENGDVIMERVKIPDTSIYTPIGDDSDTTVGDTIYGDNGVDCDAQIILDYLNTLSPTQKQIVELKLQGLSDNEVKEILGLSDKKYEKCYSQLKSLDNKLKIKEMFREETSINNEEDKPMITTQTAEKSKPMQYSIASINKKIENRTIRFDHPLQRESDQWSPAMKGNLVSDILQGNPLPEIVFAEQIINGMPVVWDLDGKQRCTNCYSYANDGFKVSKNIRRWEISYIAQIKDENGKPVLDENSFPISEYRTFDIRNKKFSQLPKELQEKFLDYTFKCDQYLNCDSEEIAYHIIRYNEGKSMTKAQKGITRIGEEFAMMVKSISAMPFFREIGGYKLSEAKNGTLERVVVESVMASKYLDDWKKEQEYICEYLKDNATTEDFDNFEDLVTRLETVVTEDVADMFDSKDSFLWFGLFARFVKSEDNDEKFIEFMAEFAQSLHSKEVNGISFDSLCINANGNTRGTKDKNMVIDKMELLENLMDEFFHIKKVDVVETETVDIEEDGVEIYISEITGIDVGSLHENIDWYISMLEDENGLKDRCIRDDSRLLNKDNSLSLLAMVAYAESKEENLDEWLTEYASNNDEYLFDQKENFLYMKESFDTYLAKCEVA